MPVGWMRLCGGCIVACVIVSGCGSDDGMRAEARYHEVTGSAVSRAELVLTRLSECVKRRRADAGCGPDAVDDLEFASDQAWHDIQSLIDELGGDCAETADASQRAITLSKHVLLFVFDEIRSGDLYAAELDRALRDSKAALARELRPLRAAASCG